MVRGHLATEALAAAIETDVVFINVMSRGPIAKSAPSLRKTAQAGRSGEVVGRESKPVWVIFDESPESERTLRLAGELCAAGQAELIVALPPDNTKSETRLRSEAVRLLSGLPAAVHFVPLPGLDISSILAVVGSGGCSLLVLRQNHPLLTGSSGAKLLERIECPVVLIR